MDIGKNIRKLRKEQGLTLEELGKRVGLPKQTIQRYENGVIKNIPYDKLVALAKALDCTGADFFVGVEGGEKFLIEQNHTSDRARKLMSYADDVRILEVVESYKKLSSTNQNVIRSMIQTLAENQNTKSE